MARSDKTKTVRCVLPVLVAIASCGVMVVANAQPASTYQMSCTNIGAAGSTLFANCRRIDGSFSKTQIQIPGIENINGQLRFNGMGYKSTFQDSCSEIQVTGSTPSALCRRIDGSMNRTSIPIFGIANINGNLQYQD